MVLADILVEVGVPQALEVGKIIPFQIFSLPLMLNYCHKSLFYVTKKGAWGGGIMIMHHFFLENIAAHKPISRRDLFLPSANE